ncbi:hypothetical protein B0O99DRAFT_566445 [Bisporella sp. PMI_857]|nr:hypothetical protein B0O99DRAFT_566445 [Bisporella sp. PMI_857]
MKTIPSLVASSTVGIAAAGLALGRPEASTSPRPTSKKRKVGDLADAENVGSSPLIERPYTSSAVITPEQRNPHSDFKPSPSSLPPVVHQRPLTIRADNNNNMGGRRWSIVRHGDLSSPIEGDENRRDSISSRGSWMKRLSAIQISGNNSPRSSIGPDSPSLTFSHGSATPILSNSGGSPAQLPPNKLVKRIPSGRLSTSVPRSGSKSQVPTLRRPATSHQRSITLQQQFREHSIDGNRSPYETPRRQTITATLSSKSASPATRNYWRPFFESRPTKLTKEKLSGKSTDGAANNFYSTSRRVIPDETIKAVLVKPGLITKSKSNTIAYVDEDSLPLEDEPDDEEEPVVEDEVLTSTPNPEEPHKRARRSLSMNFSSPSSWVLRSGSLRGNKRNQAGKSGGKRYSSAPSPGRDITISQTSPKDNKQVPKDGHLLQQQRLAELTSQAGPPQSAFHQRSRNTSSPLPPLSRLSSFNVDLARLGLSSSSSNHKRGPNSPALRVQTTSTSTSTPGGSAPTSPLYFNSHAIKSSRTSDAVDRASTLIGSESDIKGFASGDEDDMDFQSETVFDSLRSGATGSVRSHNTQLDGMFDESPPSISASKSKRLSIHELLNGLRDENDKIVEEDEGMPTPVKGARSRSSEDGNLRTPVKEKNADYDDQLEASPPNFSLATKDFGRLSLDDEEDDEDWTRDEDDNPEIQSLSLPSSSLNSRKVSPSFRAALADLTDSPSANEIVLPSIERPKSNLFDWSEPSSTEKSDLMGNSPRPKTAHAKQVSDGRGGRAIGRRGPTALHIRSQSVPVVPDVAGQREHSKLASKFGTWGLGSKGVSEEWDGDFEFESPTDDAEDGDYLLGNSGMIVPPAIQASQDHVVGHVGQIREVCLLVDDLKRLRLLAREKGLLDGPSAPLWKEAEGIIALAVPDEEDPTLSPAHSPVSIGFESEVTDDRYVDFGFDAEDVEISDAPVEVLNDQGPTGFVYDGNTVRRRSVFAPDDDIFGAGSLVHSPIRDHLRPPSTSPRQSSVKASSEYARSVMETMHKHRATSDPQSLNNLIDQSPNKMPFDTTSLRDLVNRASALSRTLSELIRKADGSQSPEARSHRESSPAFTRVFTPTAEAMASPPKHLSRSYSNNSMLSGSIDASPSRNLGQRMHMMTVI